MKNSIVAHTTVRPLIFCFLVNNEEEFDAATRFLSELWLGRYSIIFPFKYLELDRENFIQDIKSCSVDGLFVFDEVNDSITDIALELCISVFKTSTEELRNLNDGYFHFNGIRICSLIELLKISDEQYLDHIFKSIVLLLSNCSDKEILRALTISIGCTSSWFKQELHKLAIGNNIRPEIIEINSEVTVKAFVSLLFHAESKCTVRKIHGQYKVMHGGNLDDHLNRKIDRFMYEIETRSDVIFYLQSSELESLCSSWNFMRIQNSQLHRYTVPIQFFKRNATEFFQHFFNVTSGVTSITIYGIMEESEAQTLKNNLLQIVKDFNLPNGDSITIEIVFEFSILLDRSDIFFKNMDKTFVFDCESSASKMFAIEKKIPRILQNTNFGVGISLTVKSHHSALNLLNNSLTNYLLTLGKKTTLRLYGQEMSKRLRNHLNYQFNRLSNGNVFTVGSDLNKDDDLNTTYLSCIDFNDYLQCYFESRNFTLSRSEEVTNCNIVLRMINTRINYVDSFTVLILEEFYAKNKGQRTFIRSKPLFDGLKKLSLANDDINPDVFRESFEKLIISKSIEQFFVVHCTKCKRKSYMKLSEITEMKSCASCASSLLLPFDKLDFIFSISYEVLEAFRTGSLALLKIAVALNETELRDFNLELGHKIIDKNNESIMEFDMILQTSSDLVMIECKQIYSKNVHDRIDSILKKNKSIFEKAVSLGITKHLLYLDLEQKNSIDSESLNRLHQVSMQQKVKGRIFHLVVGKTFYPFCDESQSRELRTLSSSDFQMQSDFKLNREPKSTYDSDTNDINSNGFEVNYDKLSTILEFYG